jgi:hypothetical protein
LHEAGTRKGVPVERQRQVVHVEGERITFVEDGKKQMVAV